MWPQQAPVPPSSQQRLSLSSHAVDGGPWEKLHMEKQNAGRRRPPGNTAWDWVLETDVGSPLAHCLPLPTMGPRTHPWSRRDQFPRGSHGDSPVTGEAKGLPDGPTGNQVLGQAAPECTGHARGEQP